MQARARKRFGQHFLHDRDVIERILQAIDPRPGQPICEIGPGRGALTLPLLQRCGRLTAIELDRDLIPRLAAAASAHGELELINADVLEFDFASLPGDAPWRLVGNLPYNISTPLMFHLLERVERIADMHFMLQKEVARRIVAERRLELRPTVDHVAPALRLRLPVRSGSAKFYPAAACRVGGDSLAAADFAAARDRRRRNLRAHRRGRVQPAPQDAGELAAGPGFTRATAALRHRPAIARRKSCRGRLRPYQPELRRVTRLSVIVAMDRNRLIGRANALPWHLPADLAFFKRTTLGKPVVMGRKTYESIGRPLPGRRNIVVTRNPDFDAPGCEIAASLDEAIERCADAAEIMLIGGANLYAQGLDRASCLYLTRIDHAFADGDAWFPELDSSWELDDRVDFDADQDNIYPYSFIKYRRDI